MALSDKKAYHAARYQANKEAVKARVRAYAQEHKDEIREYKKAYADKNKDKLKAKAKENYQAQREERISKQKRYAASNREKVQAYKKDWWNKNREREVQKKRANGQRSRVLAMKWYRENYHIKKDEYVARGRKRRALLAGVTVSEKIDFAKILRDSKGLCGICRKPFDLFGIDFDHIVPLSKGGSHTEANLQATHSYCNRAKGSRLA